MHKIYYKLNKNLDPNRLLHDIKQMISTHQKVNSLDDAILSIEIKDVTLTQDERKAMTDDRETEM